jgi:hypothetical protein
LFKKYPNELFKKYPNELFKKYPNELFKKTPRQIVQKNSKIYFVKIKKRKDHIKEMERQKMRTIPEEEHLEEQKIDLENGDLDLDMKFVNEPEISTKQSMEQSMENIASVDEDNENTGFISQKDVERDAEKGARSFSSTSSSIFGQSFMSTFGFKSFRGVPITLEEAKPKVAWFREKLETFVSWVSDSIVLLVAKVETYWTGGYTKVSQDEFSHTDDNL